MQIWRQPINVVRNGFTKVLPSSEIAEIWDGKYAKLGSIC